MTATLKKLTSKTNAVDIEVDGDPKAITVEYSTRRLTPRVQEEITKLLVEGDPNDMRPTIRQFLTLVVAWNFAADEGEPPIPLEEEALMDVPVELLGLILDKITVDLDPKGKIASSSNGRSAGQPSTT